MGVQGWGRMDGGGRRATAWGAARGEAERGGGEGGGGGEGAEAREVEGGEGAEAREVEGGEGAEVREAGARGLYAGREWGWSEAREEHPSLHAHAALPLSFLCPP